MFDEIVVGIDETGSEDALALAPILARPGARLTLVHVITVEDGERDRARDLLHRVGGQLRTAAPDTVVEVRCIESMSHGRGLHELAESLHADVIVVGSSRRGLFGRVLLGDDTRAALEGAPSAVAVAPTGYAAAAAPIMRIGVGFDGSVDGEHALDVARRLAADQGGVVAACTAVSVPLTRFGPGDLPVQGRLERLVDEALERIAAHGAIEAHATYGLAPEELTVFSGTVDLLVVGSRGYGPVGRMIHGSTSRQLARSAHCPLLVLAHTEAAGAGTGGSGDAAESVSG